MIEDIEQLKDSANARRKKKRDKEISDLRKVLGMVEGRRLIWKLMSEAGVFRSSFDQSDMSMAFNEGRRDMGLMLMDDILKVAPQSFSQMQKEAVSDMKSEHAQGVEDVLDEEN